MLLPHLFYLLDFDPKPVICLVLGHKDEVVKVAPLERPGGDVAGHIHSESIRCLNGLAINAVAIVVGKVTPRHAGLVCDLQKDLFVVRPLLCLCAALASS